MRIKGYILAALSAITYGLIPLFAIPLKQTDFSFDTALFYRFLLSTIMIGLFLFYQKVDFKITWKEGGMLAILGLMYSGSALFLFTGYDYMSAGIASTILFLYPILVALIMGLGFKEKISGVIWGAIFLAFLGVLSLNGGAERIPLIGFAVVFLSALTYALYMVIVNKSNLKHVQGTKVTFYSMAFCTLFFLCKSLFDGNFQAIPSFEIGINLTLFALVTTVISLICLVYAIKYIGSTPTAILGSMEPLVAVAVSVIIFHETFTFYLLLGISLILIAVLLTVLSDNLLRIVSKKRKVI
ncbi:drug/metabolite transporter (DMT)-like permease [Parabacteroides sp. PF5-5]|uniref:DMT family transporter n=1 Tax=unclassified Parabacteroides TaxID=2649774 RepID=UPI002476AC03|nr:MULTISPECIES: DMT family transporter [unclassified Parabacteroides]MDH6303714.1 drug/metabolite transporter (DMT)-like permease [Parabacteroides sp. PH5-39]MDH6314331.1 drug/metabolite transporter (DMT)-like permease [Parabacteroides sp. PF5-13]MDH6318605.1 drug/metabolite transporter (DMT)-like permease [Parabacteroides sp. PH5-13]MDH6322103.1 drug/metabolite transporter (DMT)-like permease [Parabacteroides sp. PH5-8]MDH6325818.1 drug/metabolite transporter (DMT)-like permease [Parabactero